jgi:hypothetical protein
VIDDRDHDEEAASGPLGSPSLETDAPGADGFMIIDLESNGESSRIAVNEKERTMAFREWVIYQRFRGSGE